MAYKRSIVISGWPAVGKTTVAGELAKEFDLKVYNGGDILKKLASEKGYQVTGKDWWDGEEARKFMAERQSNPSFDKELDRKLIKVAELGNAVITSYTLPWLTKYPVKFWLKGSQDNRAKRMANRDEIRVTDAKKIIRQRDATNGKIYSELYGIKFGEDLTVFDFSLNTDLLTLASVIDISKNTVRHLINQ